MTVDLRGQLQELCAVIDEEQGPISADDVRARVIPVRSLDRAARPPVSSRRSWLVAAAAAASILIIVGGLAWLTRLGGDVAPAGDPTETTVPSTPDTSVPETTIPQTTIPVTTVPVPPTTVSAPAVTPPRVAELVTWTKHEGSAPADGGISETPVGFTSVSIVDFRVPRVFMSVNGLDWTEVPLPAGSAIPIPEDSHFDVEPTEVGTWLTGPAGGIWFADVESWSSGAPSWKEVVSETDLLELKGPAPTGLKWTYSTGLEWTYGISGKARLGNTSFVAVQWEATIDYASILDLPPGYTNINHDDLDSCYSSGTPGQLSLRGLDASGREVCLGRVTVVDDANGVRILDENGTQVASIENVVAAFDHGSGGPTFVLPSEMLDLYASTDGRLELIRSVDDAIDGCRHGLEQGEDSVVHSIDCPESSLNGALPTDDGVTWQQVPFEEQTAIGSRHPLGFFWKSTWPWGPPSNKQGPSVILVSDDGETWTELAIERGPVFEVANGLVITQFDEEGALGEDIVVYDGELSSTVRADWPVADRPDFWGTIGNTLIVIDGGDVWVGELFES